MRHFSHASASHADWRQAVELLLARLGSERGKSVPKGSRRLAFVYATDPMAGRLEQVLEELGRRRQDIDWVGAIAHGVYGVDAEFREQPALAAMVCELPRDSFSVFGGRNRLEMVAPTGGVHAALVHADPATPDLNELLGALLRHVPSGEVFGGVVGGDTEPALQLAGDVISGGVSGVALGPQARTLSRLTQGCSPLAGEHIVSSCSAQYIQTLDGRPALDVLLDDLDVPAEARSSRDGEEILRALPSERLARGLMIGLAPGGSTPRGIGFGDFRVRNVIGIDPTNRLLAVAATPEPGERAVFCTRDQKAARADLTRICTELREEVESESLRILGAHYVSCVARGAHLFGAPGAELELIAHNLGKLPLVGFLANAEIAGDRIYGYTGILTLFVEAGENGR